MRQLSLHVNDGTNNDPKSQNCHKHFWEPSLSQLGDTCAEDNRKLAKAFSSVLPVLGLVPSSSRVGALACY